MQGLNINTVAQACNGKIYTVDSNISNKEFTGVEIDSRNIMEGNLFIATQGERVDGHSFIPSVFEKGALAVICEKLPEKMDGTCILVEDSFQALKDIAKYYRSILDIKVVGVTGSVGKTSTKEVLASVLSERYCVLKTAGNFNNEVGLPLTVLRIRKEHEIAVLEMGISHFGEMERLAEIAHPDVCVITNIGPCHLEFLGDLDGVLKAKTEMFQYLNPNGFACLNGDDAKLMTIQSVNDKKPVFFGKGSNCVVTATDINNKGLLGSEALLHINGQTAHFHIHIPGEHMVQNALCAATVGDSFGLTLEEIVSGIEKAETVKGRSRITDTGKLVVVDDCYNANPVSMKAAISLLETAVSRKVAILGDMFELGENEEKLHQDVGSFLSHTNINVVICIGALAKNIYDQVADSDKQCYYFETKDAFEKELSQIILENDTVLIKASNGMKFSSLVDACLSHTWL